jgi:protein disulfide-isomerase
MTLRFRHLPTLLLLATLGCGPAATKTETARETGRAEAPSVAQQQTTKAAALPATSAGLTFLTDYQAASAQARAEGKPLLLLFGAEWCAHTQRMTGELRTDAQLAKLAGEFICVRLDVDAVPKLCEEFRVRAYPTLVIAAPGGVVLQRLTGLQTSSDVAHEMSAALTAVADRFPTGTTTLQR